MSVQSEKTTSKNNISKQSLLKRLEQGPVFCAEGYLFELERRGYLKAGAFVPEVVLDYPEAVTQLHTEFLRCGSDVIEAFTYYAHRDKLRVIGREHDLEPLNRQALKLAKDVASKNNALFAGNICNTWAYDPDDKEASSQVVRAMFEEQVSWAKQEDVDFIIAETISHLGEALIALEVIKSKNVPAVVTLAPIGDHTKTADGYELIEACQRIEAAGADVVGFNCNIGPDAMLRLVKKLRKAVSCHIAALPVPYRTDAVQHFWDLTHDGKTAFPDQLDPLLHTRYEMADFARKALDAGVSYIGICCGGAPHHVRAMVEALGRTTPASKYSPDMNQHGTVSQRS